MTERIRWRPIGKQSAVFGMKEKQYQPQHLYFSTRLTEALGGILDHPLTIVEAPMGYGKTTAVREYLYKADIRILWQSIYDGATANFWRGFWKLFADLDGECALNLSKLGLPDDSISRQEALELIAGVSFHKKTVLVIDDYHLIHNPDIHDFIVFLARHEIPHLHIILVTRVISLEILDELKLKRYAHHITKETFELSPDDIASYYKLCGIILTSDQIAPQAYRRMD